MKKRGGGINMEKKAEKVKKKCAKLKKVEGSRGQKRKGEEEGRATSLFPLSVKECVEYHITEVLGKCSREL